MRSINDKTTREELIKRVSSITEQNKVQWGTMNAFQILKHCVDWEELALGKKTQKRSIMGFLFGKILLNSTIKDEKDLGRNLPTLPELIVNEANGNFAAEKAKWILLLECYNDLSEPQHSHPVFGKINKVQLGRLSYKHNDHHLRQLGV